MSPEEWAEREARAETDRLIEERVAYARAKLLEQKEARDRAEARERERRERRERRRRLFRFL